MAVLPFVSKDSDGNIIQQEGRLLVDNLSLISDVVEETPVQAVRRAAISELKKTSLDLVSTALIDLDLPHHGYAGEDGSLDIARLLKTKPSDLCSSFLSCDAVMYGTITRWDRSYYGIESVNSVGIELSLVSAKSGAILFSALGEDSEGRGISKIPTGLSSVVLEPIKGLDSEIISDLGASVVKKLIEPLAAASRQQIYDSSPPAIFAASHDGKGRVINESKPLIVVMFGSEKAQASFSIGSIALDIPMIEGSEGHYYGEFIPLKTDMFEDQAVIVTLIDAQGRKNMQKVPAGLVSVANPA